MVLTLHSLIPNKTPISRWLSWFATYHKKTPIIGSLEILVLYHHDNVSLGHVLYVNVLMITLSYQTGTVKKKLQNHLKKVVGFLTLLVFSTELIFQLLTVLEEMQIILTEKVTHQFSYNL
jgi:hypothetical protein